MGIRDCVVALALCVAVGACGGGGRGVDEEAFSDWYSATEAERQEVAGDDVDKYTVAEGLAEARSTCRELEGANAVDELDDISRRMENSLGGRYFIDATTEWICPDEAEVIEDLIEAGTVDYRAVCEEDEDDIGCSVPGPDPLDF